MNLNHLSFSALVLTLFLSACSSTQREENRNALSSTEQTPVPQFIKDPYEPVNRGIWAFNEGLLKNLVHPSARVYRATLPKPVRGSIRNFQKNITYPGRLVNNLLQGRWTGMKNETLRFLSNSTVGIAGLFDPATRWGISPSQASFNQTLGKWGWRPEKFIVLPLFGPSDERHATGFFADRALNPLNYLNSPYRSASFLTTYNQLADLSETAKQLLDIEADSYSIVKYAWTYGSKQQQPDLELTGPIDPSSLQTLAAVSIAPKDPKFLAHAKKLKVKIPTTRKKLPFHYWLQPQPAPLVYILPGLNAHSLSNLPLALAETLYQQGYSVVSTTSVFHPEFMENASSSELPIYAPADSRDLLIALSEFDKTLTRKHPDRLTQRALIGLSMGGYLSLNLATLENGQTPQLLDFDRYIAINAPVDMVHSARLIDSYMDAPLKWPAAERQARINNAVHKATANGLFSRRKGPPIPFDGIESKYLVGLSFRFGLRDLIYSSESRNNHGVLTERLSKRRREKVYGEIMSFSYQDYFHKIAAPYYQEKGITKKEILRHANLRNKERKLRHHPKVRILTNQNDFLLQKKDLAWLKKNFSRSQLTIFPQGGHLGNLNEPQVEKAILKALHGLKDDLNPRSLK